MESINEFVPKDGMSREEISRMPQNAACFSEAQYDMSDMLYCRICLQKSSSDMSAFRMEMITAQPAANPMRIFVSLVHTWPTISPYDSLNFSSIGSGCSFFRSARRIDFRPTLIESMDLTSSTVRFPASTWCIRISIGSPRQLIWFSVSPCLFDTVMTLSTDPSTRFPSAVQNPQQIRL